MEGNNRTKEKKNFWFIYRYVMKTVWTKERSIIYGDLCEIFFCVVASLGATVVPALIIELLQRTQGVREFALWIAIIFLFYGAIVSGQGYFSKRASFEYIRVRLIQFVVPLLQKCMKMDYGIFEQGRTHERLNQAEYCIEGSEKGLEGFLKNHVQFMITVILTICYSMMTVQIHPLFLFLLFVITVIQIWVHEKAVRYERNNEKKRSKLFQTQEYINDLTFQVEAGKDIRLYQLQPWLHRIYVKANKQFQTILSKEGGFFYLYDMTGIVLQFIRDLVCYGFLLYQLKHGMEPALFVLYLGAVTGFSTYVSKIFDHGVNVKRAATLLESYVSFMEEPDLFFHGTGEKLDDHEETVEIVFDHVTFIYPESDRVILDDVSFRIKKGEKLALVGLNGAGKTTIVKLICGFHKVTKGVIYINGVNINELDMEQYFQLLAIVFQDSFFFAGSIEENIRGGFTEETDQKKLERVLQQAGIWEKVKSLPNGIQSIMTKELSKDGVEFSGGERQKLMLARALYKEAKLYILDEPTAALDAIAESELYEKYAELIKEKTAIFISHRLASTKICDEILLLEHGTIKERGTHEQLLEKNGEYAHMFHVQSQYYQEEQEEWEDGEDKA